jgi:hypothetical protein
MGKINLVETPEIVRTSNMHTTTIAGIMYRIITKFKELNAKNMQRNVIAKSEKSEIFFSPFTILKSIVNNRIPLLNQRPCCIKTNFK